MREGLLLAVFSCVFAFKLVALCLLLVSVEWLVVGGWWLVVGGWWLVVGGECRHGALLALMGLGGSGVGCRDSLLELGDGVVGRQGQGARGLASSNLGSERSRVERDTEGFDQHAAEDLGRVRIDERHDTNLND